jgi:putative ABC transport system substrate-binding protein
MKRRDFITLLGGATVAWPLAARAQQPASVRRIGFLGSTSASGHRRQVEAFRAGLRDLGYVEGKNIIIEFRWAEGDYDRLPDLAADLLGLKIDILVTHGTPGALAAKQATTTIPIVMAAIADPVAAGVVASIARPGGNITGMTFFNPEISAKRLELLKETFPSLQRAAILFNPNNPASRAVLQAIEHTAGALRVNLQQFEAREPKELEGAFSAMAKEAVDALVIIEDPMLIANAGAIGNLALKQRFPSIGFKEIAEAGGLLAYGVDLPEMFRRAAALVDKILKGGKPGELPVERSTKFELVINLKTAKTLGLDLPPTLFARADEVIE